MYVIVVVWAFQSYGALKAQKTADITKCQPSSAVLRPWGSWVACAVAVVCLSFCLVLGALFSGEGHFSGGVGFRFWLVVPWMMPIGPGPCFFSLAQIVSGIGPFALGIFGTHMWRTQGRKHAGLSPPPGNALAWAN